MDDVKAIMKAAAVRPGRLTEKQFEDAWSKGVDQVVCRKCGHRKDSHAFTVDGYACSRCKCRRRFWR